MRISLEDLMEKLGTGRVMTPYESQPWVVYDADQGITCSAEVRVGPGYSDIETEIQFLYDEFEMGVVDPDAHLDPPPPQMIDGVEVYQPPRPKNLIIDGQQQILKMRILPATEDTWSPTSLLVKGIEYYNKFPNWDEKGIDFFRAAIETMLMGEIPNFDEMIESTLVDDSDWGGGRRGRIGRKSPKANPAALLGMKK
ncbi:MAG: hypothetical protein ACK4VI_03550 [Alphaproteobacteria bacterium]